MSASAPLRTLLTDRAILIPAMGVVLAAFGWGIVEPLLPERLAKFGVTPSWVGLIFTISTITYGLSAPLVAWVGASCCWIKSSALSKRVPGTSW